jgi:hypothetical protein
MVLILIGRAKSGTLEHDAAFQTTLDRCVAVLMTLRFSVWTFFLLFDRTHLIS